MHVALQVGDAVNVQNCRAVIIVFAMAGCPACEDYKPRLVREVERWRAQHAPFLIVERDEGQTFAHGEIPVILIDAEAEHDFIQGLADQYKIQGVPATLLLTHRAAPEKLEGALDDREIYDLLTRAARA